MNHVEIEWVWWATIVFINIVNVGICAHFYRQSRRSADGASVYLTRMRIMGLVFTMVALYRAIFVSRYLYQYAWFDTIANSSLLIRMGAWAAELSFASLVALAMLRFSADMPGNGRRPPVIWSRYAKTAPYALIACIFTAQFFATGGLISKSRLLFAIEETLWSAGFLAVLPLAVNQFRQAFFDGKTKALTDYSMLRTFSAVNLAWCIGYCSYGLAYHLPTEYWASAFEQLNTGIPEIRTGLSAVTDAFTVVNVTHDFGDWGPGFVFWHSAYFTVCVWLAIFLMRGPRKLATR